MNCTEFMKLDDQEQKEFIGELVHAAMSSNWGFESAKEIISFVKMQGKFIGVKIGNDAFRDTSEDLPIFVGIQL